MTPTRLVVRGVEPDLERRLRALSEVRGESLDATVLHLLEQAIGPAAREKELERFATWTEEDFEEFMEILREQRQVHEKDWR